MASLNWVKAQSGSWLSLEKVNLSEVNVFGVYIIWHRGNPGRVVRVGQGDIAARVGSHKRDTDILAYAHHGLHVTWARCTVAQADGIERYLADQWNPLVGDRWPNATPIAVNSPW